jgi:cytochrome c5
MKSTVTSTVTSTMTSTRTSTRKRTIALSLLMLAALAACGDKAPASAASGPSAPAPVEAAAAPAPAAPSAAELAAGEKIYAAACASCHAAAVMGAPKLGDKPSWTPRLAKGVEVLYGSAMNGFKMMPPRGGNAALKDEEIRSVVDFMVSKAH